MQPVPVEAQRLVSPVDSAEVQQVEQEPTRRGVLAGAALMASSGISSGRAQAAPAEPFCGIAGGAVPGWAYKTAFDQFAIDFDGQKTWIRIVGNPPPAKSSLAFLGSKTNPKLPVLIIHGGPGLPSQYMESLELLASEGRQVIFYDQTGCGNSLLASKGKQRSEAEWTLDLFLKELDAVCQEVGLTGPCHLLGHGWGGQLALAAAARPGASEGIVSLSLISTAPSTASLVADRRQCVETLPAEVQAVLLQGDSNNARGAVPWEAAMQAYTAAFVHRQPRSCVDRARTGASAPVFQAMCGGKLLSAAGQLAEWDCTPDLKSITPPTLVVRGEYDEVSQASADVLVQGLPNGRGLVCLEAGSFCHLDNPTTLLQEVNDHMDAADGSTIAS